MRAIFLAAALVLLTFFSAYANVIPLPESSFPLPLETHIQADLRPGEILVTASYLFEATGQPVSAPSSLYPVTLHSGHQCPRRDI